MSCCIPYLFVAGDGWWTQGITNTVGAIPGVLGVALVGIILDRTQSWTVSYDTRYFID